MHESKTNKPLNQVGVHVHGNKMLKKNKKKSSRPNFYLENPKNIYLKNQTNVDACGCLPKEESVYTYKQELEKLFKSKRPVNQIFDGVQFNLVNPTTQPCSFNLFDGYPLQNVPNTPTNGYVQNQNPIVFTPNVFPAVVQYPNIECATINTAPTYTKPLATTYVPTTDRVYVAAQSTAAQILVVNPNTNTIVNVIPTLLFGDSWMLVFCSAQNTAYLIDKTTAEISVTDCATETHIINIVLPAVPSQISYSPSNNYLYVTVPSLNRLYYIDCSTNAIVGFITLTGSVTPTALVTWSAGGNNLALVLNTTNNLAHLINTTSNLIIGVFSVTNSCDANGAICYNSVKNTVYYVDSTVTIREIDMATFTMLPTAISGFAPSSQVYQLLFISAFNVIYTGVPSSPFNVAKIINCVSNSIDLVVTTSANGAVGNRLSYDPVNNSVWMTGDGTNNIISKLCNNVNATCYITGSTEYNEFIQDFGACPKCVRQIVLFTQSAAQTAVPFEIMTRDADGNSCTNPLLPNIKISTDQFQPNMAIIDFKCKDLILNNQFIFSNYTIAPMSTVTMIIWYKEICKGEVLSITKSLCHNTETKCADGNSRTESQLKFQSPRPTTRPEWTKPFKDKMTGKKNPYIPDTSIDACKPCEELGRPNFPAILSKNINDFVIVKNVPKKPDTNVGKCDDICAVIGYNEDVYKKPSLDKYYKKAVNNFDVFQKGVKVHVVKKQNKNGKKIITPKRKYI